MRTYRSKARRPGQFHPFILGLVLGAMSFATCPWTAEAQGQVKPLFPTSREERALITGLLDLQGGNLDGALRLLQQLIGQQPDFKLAQLVYGDLLMARAGRLKSFGNGGPPDRIQELRHEAQVRLSRYLESPRPSDLPTQLLRMPDDVTTALLFDIASNRLYVFRNRGDGWPEWVEDFYVSIGKAGIDKKSEGDGKTPIGVYHVDAYLPPSQLPDLYGAGAFPIDYPNAWDQLRGRTGSGIWIHGTESGTYSRAPLSSLGCLTLSNTDFQQVRQEVAVGRTPVVVANGLTWTDAETLQRQRDEFTAVLDRWVKDWESRDTERYLSHYSSRFTSGGGTDLRAFAAHKRRVNAGKSFIQVTLKDVGVYFYPGEQELVMVEFLQDYRSSNLNAQRRKHQYWRKESTGWKIVFEAGA